MTGWRLLLTRPAEECEALAATLAEAGVHSSSLPLLAIEPLPESAEQRATILELDRYCAVVVVSKPAARLGLELLDRYWPQPPFGQAWFSVGGATDAEPGLTERGLRPVAIEQFQAQAGGRLADHDDGAIAIQLEDRCTLLGGLRQRLDRQQRQAGAVHTSLGESRGQCLAFLGRPGQQQAPAGHA